ncbi:alpha/beta fold hydrolase [Montanilutibacter psychrotolerans]|uniref:Alpha/beta hydrolase n=1 Tax=Montanilutibacter psychrotolerans TaxID=1327343 RepID=A0A3M8SMM8_9GAMM|nr:alpha/beta hydrolase [Lysobacter psychrotolerans]RNF82628.1 alpha/beta hydrolase [Lysobacter psychrotolerans]
MQRRQFMAMAGGAMAGGVLAAWLPQVAGAASTAAATTPVAAGAMDAAAFHASRRFAQTAFGRIAYVERGAGEVALFLHGFPLNSFQWRGALDRLSAYRRCIAPDFMALGYSEIADDQDVSPDAQVEMLVALLDKLSIATVDLVASDSGGAVAQLFVTRHRERVRTLLLTNCDEAQDCPPPALLPVIELSRKGQFVDQWLGRWHADKALARSPEGIGGMCYFDPRNPTDEAIDCYFAPLLASPQRKAQVHAYAVALERNSLLGIEPALKACTVPTRIVWGMGDTIFSPADPDRLDRSFGNSRGVRRLEGSKLFWPEERPDVVAEEARALWGV